MALVKSTGSSIIMVSFIQGVCCITGRFIALLFMKVGETMGDSCLTGGETICDCRGNGLCIGGVGGALCRANGLSKANDLVVGVPSYDTGELLDA
jgi:hypothetical protein